MKNMFCQSIFVFICLCTHAAVGQSQKTTLVRPGVSWISDFHKEGPLNYNILKVNVGDPAITLETEPGHDRLFRGETVGSSIKREAANTQGQIVAGVNADFWVNSPRMYSPVGFLVSDGMIHTMPSAKRSAFVVTKDERLYIGKVTLDMKLSGDFGKLSIDGINTGLKGQSDVVLFTPPYGEVGPAAGLRFALIQQRNLEFLPNQPSIVQVKQIDNQSTVSLKPGIMVLHIPPVKSAQARKLKNDAVITLLATLPEVQGAVSLACGGGPALIKNGQLVDPEEGHGKSFAETRHPRTAVGFTRDGKTVFLVTVDGRQPSISIGSSLSDLAKYMKQLGCWYAMNLDGGGSTTMVVNDKVANKPSDVGGPRAVANSLFVVVK